MRTKLFVWKHYAMAVFAVLLLAAVSSNDINADGDSIDRYKVDFLYQGIGYQILSESDKTVAVTQDYDIDAVMDRTSVLPPSRSDIGENGFLMSYGLTGPVVNIPQTVYDEEGIAYTVTALANGAIDYESIGELVLPPTLKHLNGGINLVNLNSLYLPATLKEVSGINHCLNLQSLYIPREVEKIDDYSLMACGIKTLYIPPSVKILGKEVLSRCDSLLTVMLSGVETAGEGALSNNNSFWWANLPETLKSLDDGCFNNCENLERISLPWSEIKMNECFNGCPKVECIEILAVEPYPFPENCFKDVDRATCDLLVPEESTQKYMETDGWKDFFRINGVLTSNPNNVLSIKSNLDFVAIGGSGSMRVLNKGGVTLDIVNPSGVKVYSSSKVGECEIPLARGIYIVSTSKGSCKVRVH